MGLVGRSAELGELAALLDRGAAGFGGVITLVGTAGSGKSALAAEAAALARDRGLEVVGGSPVRGRPGRLVWAGLLDDLGTDTKVTGALLDDSGSLDTTMAVRLLTAGARRLIVPAMRRALRPRLDAVASPRPVGRHATSQQPSPEKGGQYPWRTP